MYINNKHINVFQISHSLKMLLFFSVDRGTSYKTSYVREVAKKVIFLLAEPLREDTHKKVFL